MSSFKEYMKKALDNEKIVKKEKTEINEDFSFKHYLNKHKNSLNEENEMDEDEEEIYKDMTAGEGEEDDNYEDDSDGETQDDSDDYEKDEDEEEETGDVPIATKDESVNIENRQKAIDEFVYGPEKIEESNDDFWNNKKTKFMVKTTDLAKQKLCGNCAAFNIKSEMLKNLDNGIDKEIDESDSWDADKKNRGFCEFLDFKCHKMRTCNSWVEGGPLKDKTETTALTTATNNAVVTKPTPPATSEQ